MDNTEAKIMTLTLERERLVRQHVEQGRILRALKEQPARVERARAASAVGLLRRLAAGARPAFRRWLQLPWDERAPRVSAATADA